MRKAQREIQEQSELATILEACDVCHLGLVDGSRPYVVPLNYGYEWSGDQLTLYFHCAAAGRKLDIIRCNPLACFQMDWRHQLVTGELACQYTMNYESLIGSGPIEILEETAGRIHGLQLLMAHYSKRADWEYDPQILDRTAVLRLRAEEFCGKRLKRE